jgi:hypothetical protein
MSVIEKTIALLGGLNPQDLQALPPFERRRFADICRHWADLAEQRAYSSAPRPGVLSDLRTRRRDE